MTGVQGQARKQGISLFEWVKELMEPLMVTLKTYYSNWLKPCENFVLIELLISMKTINQIENKNMAQTLHMVYKKKLKLMVLR